MKVLAGAIPPFNYTSMALMMRNTQPDESHSFVPEKIEARKSDVILKMDYTDIDTIRYALPEEIYPEFLPKDISIKSRFGQYEAIFKVDQGQLVYIRKMTMSKGRFPASSYQALIDFYRGVSKARQCENGFMSKM